MRMVNRLIILFFYFDLKKKCGSKILISLLGMESINHSFFLNSGYNSINMTALRLKRKRMKQSIQCTFSTTLQLEEGLISLYISLTKYYISFIFRICVGVKLSNNATVVSIAHCHLFKIYSGRINDRLSICLFIH